MQCRRHGRSLGFDPWVEKIPWRRKWQPTPVFLPGESHGQRSLAGYGSWGSKEAKQLSNKRKPNNFSFNTRVHRAASPARQQARPWALRGWTESHRDPGSLVRPRAAGHPALPPRGRSPRLQDEVLSGAPGPLQVWAGPALQVSRAMPQLI